MHIKHCSNRRAADFRFTVDNQHGLLVTAVCCTLHWIRAWKTSTTSSSNERYVRFLKMWGTLYEEQMYTVTTVSQQMAAMWHLQRWKYSVWRGRQWSSPFRCLQECCRCEILSPQKQSSSSPKTTEQRLWLRVGGGSSRAINSCGCFQLTLQIQGNIAALTGMFII